MTAWSCVEMDNHLYPSLSKSFDSFYYNLFEIRYIRKKVKIKAILFNYPFVYSNKGGQRMEMEQLYKEHSDKVYSYIYFLVRQKECAEDLTQETFYKAYKGLNTFNKQASTTTWLLKIARNVTYDYFRRKRVIQFFSFEKEHDIETKELSPESRFEQKEQLTKMYNSLSKLKKDYQEVLLLRKIQECSIQETAYILGWTEAKVKMKMTRALEALKKEFHQEGGHANGTIKRIR